MVTIVKHNEEEIWGLFDSKNHTLVKWSDGWELNGEYSFNIEIGTLDNFGCFNAFSEDKILENLKLLDVSSGSLPLSYEDEYSDTEYTDRETNDACRVPDFDFYNYIFKMEDKEGGIALQIELENHGTPWFMGDCYEMPDDEWTETEDRETLEGWHKCTDYELQVFKGKFIDPIIKGLEIAQKKAQAKLQKESAATLEAYEHIENEAAREIVRKHFNGKKPSNDIIDIVNAVCEAIINNKG